MHSKQNLKQSVWLPAQTMEWHCMRVDWTVGWSNDDHKGLYEREKHCIVKLRIVQILSLYNHLGIIAERRVDSNSCSVRDWGMHDTYTIIMIEPSFQCCGVLNVHPIWVDCWIVYSLTVVPLAPNMTFSASIGATCVYSTREMLDSSRAEMVKPEANTGENINAKQKPHTKQLLHT